MKRLLFTFCLLPLAAPAQAGDKGRPTLGTIERHDPRFDKLVPKGAKLEILAKGFKWTEGPCWIKSGGFLVFSDIPNNAINKWKEGEGLTKNFIFPAGYTGKKERGGEPGTNGLMLDADGNLVVCEHGDRRVSKIDLKTMKRTTLADKYKGKRFNSPNDLCFHSNGDLYFTDPPYGLEKNWDDEARELDFCGVYLLKKDGKLILLTKEMTRPNGIVLSPDEKTLYVANSDPKIAIWNAFPVKSDGTLGAAKLFFDSTKWVGKEKPGLPDGMKVDAAGNLFATGPGGVHVFAPDGTLLGTLATGVPTANCCFGEDGMTLFVAANDQICRIRLTTKGKGF
ncbi:MAG: SMP-30/gluconolactonase/LRE family protein [Gemmataceae bacterium]